MAGNEGSIIVPLDGSKNAENALPAAAMLAHMDAAPIELLYVLNSDDDSRSLEEATREFGDYGQRLIRDYHLPSGRCTVSVREGKPAATILEAARNSPWITIASHGRGGFKAMFIGSVADKVVRGTTVPVYMVPGIGRPPERPRTIVVTLDGSEEAERALGVARRIAGSVEARVVLVRALSAMIPMGVGWSAGYPESYPQLIEEDAKAYLQSLAGPDEQTYTAVGDAANVIVALAEQVDAGLVVMTSSGKGLAGRLALGSTTDRVMHSLHRPLVILPPAE